MDPRIFLLAGDSVEIRSVVVTLETSSFEVVRLPTSQALFDAMGEGEPPRALMVQVPAPWPALSQVCRQFRRAERGQRSPILVLGDRKEIEAPDKDVASSGIFPEDIFPSPYDGTEIIRRLKAIPEDGQDPPEAFTARLAQAEIRGGTFNPAAKAAPPPAPVKTLPEEATHGTLERITPARLVLFRHRNTHSGALRLVFPEGTATLYFDKGTVVGFEGARDLGLGAWLVQEGRITRAQIPTADPSLGGFIAAGVLGPHEAFATLKAHATAVLEAKASERSGAFEWQADVAPAEGMSFPLDVNLHRILLNGLIAAPPVPLPLPKKLAQGVPVVTALCKHLLPTLQLSSLESRLVRSIDGRLRLFNVVAQASGGDEERQRQMEATLIGLRDIGCIKLTAGSSLRSARVQAEALAAAQSRLRDAEAEGDDAPEPSQSAPGKTEERAAATGAASGDAALRKEVERIRDADPFDVLGVQPMTPLAEVRDTFRELTKRYHPDRFFDDPPEDQALASEIYQQMKDAFAIVSDEEQRASFVKMREAGVDHPITEEDEFLAAVAFNKGELFLKNRSWERARDSFDRAVSLDPLRLNYAIHAAWAAFRCNPQDAGRLIPRLHAHLKKEPKSALGFYYLGVMFKGYGDNEQARMAFKRAVSINGNMLEAKRELRLMDMRERKADEANPEKKTGGKGIFGFMKR